MYELRDYNIWKDGDTYMVKVKATGEVTPASQEVVRVLWSTERNEHNQIVEEIKNNVTSFDVIVEEGGSFLDSLASNYSRNAEDEAFKSIIEKTVIQQLTNRQREVYQMLVKDQMTMREIAIQLKVSVTAVWKTRNRILELFKNNSYFQG